MGEAV
jgi:hypothetical protein